jgi:ubiquinone/menaquinone biosynthesis C-methylase UbiE
MALFSQNSKVALIPTVARKVFDVTGAGDTVIATLTLALASGLSLIQSCRISQDSYVLIIGCGVGQTPCLIAEEIGCRVVGIDLSEGMVEKARERAKKKGLEDKLEFRTADAQALPFEDNLFDAVLSESVNAFIPDKANAMLEYVRVTKPGGFIGMNEVNWLIEPSPDLRAYSSLVMAGANFLTVDGWKDIFSTAGLHEVQVNSFKMDLRQQRTEEMHSLERCEALRAWKRFIKGLFTDPMYWEFTKKVMSKPGLLIQFTRSIGYGIYVSRKIIRG